jgi:hypothetical protein
MERYKYKMLTSDSKELEPLLNHMGDSGWRAVSINFLNPGEIIVIVEQKLKPETPVESE